jgi:hypothetical protein
MMQAFVMLVPVRTQIVQIVLHRLSLQQQLKINHNMPSSQPFSHAACGVWQKLYLHKMYCICHGLGIKMFGFSKNRIKFSSTLYTIQVFLKIVSHLNTLTKTNDKARMQRPYILGVPWLFFLEGNVYFV